MSKKFSMILSLILAVMMAAFISVPSFAEETDGAEWIPESAENEEAFEDEALEDGEDLITFDDDDWGYADPELIAAHTPEMTEEFIHADDPDWKPEGEDEGAPETQETPSETPAEPETKEEEPVAEDKGNEETPEEVREKEEAPAEEKENAETPDETKANEETPVQESVKEEPQTKEKENKESQAAEESKPAEDEAAPEAPDHNSGEEDKAQEAAVTVKIVATMTGENEMKLSAVVNDPEGRDYTFQWQVSVDGGKTFTDIADETAAEMDVELTEENITDMWRVKVREI